MKAPVSKIARLPESIREQLNQRLYDGVLGKQIVSWLNALPEVNQIMAELFTGHPITQQNISEWRRHGYQEWLEKKETQTRVLHLAEMFHGLEPGDQLRRVAALLAAALSEEMRQLRDLKDPDVRWRRFQRICWEFTRLRKLHTHGLALRLREQQAHATVECQPLRCV